jgi:cytochrome P450
MLGRVIANQTATAILLTYITYSLSRYPQWQRKLRSELDSLSTGLGEDFPSPQALDSLPMVDAIVMETL